MESPTAIPQKPLKVSYVDKIPSLVDIAKKRKRNPKFGDNHRRHDAEDSFLATRESLEILEMVPLDSPSDDD